MGKRIILAAFLALVLPALAGAELFKINYIPFGAQKVTVRDKASGKALWESLTRVEKSGQYIVVSEDGEGIYGQDKKFKRWHSAAFYRYEGDKATPYQASLTFRNAAGATLEAITKYYYLKEKKVVVATGSKQKEFSFLPDLIDKEEIAFAFINFPFAEKRDMELHLLTNEPTLYKIALKYLGIENVSLGGKNVSCYKLQMIPDLGLLNMLGAFVPKTYFWYKVEPPHEFVRYEGLESGLGTPYIVMAAAD
jgi:hypothetical protein